MKRACRSIREVLRREVYLHLATMALIQFYTGIELEILAKKERDITRNFMKNWIPWLEFFRIASIENLEIVEQTLLITKFFLFKND